MAERARNNLPKGWRAKYKSDRKWVTSFWKAVRIPAFLILSVIALGFGCIGFYLVNVSNSPSSGGSYLFSSLNVNSSSIAALTYPDIFYPALKLFWFFTDNKVYAANLPLEIARYLALLIGLYATWRLVSAIFYEQITTFFLRYFVKDHVIICGYNEKALLMAEKFYDDEKGGRDVVFIVSEIAPRDREKCIDAGAMVLVGNPADPAQLERANLRKAKYLISLLPGDGDNVQVALNAHAIKEAKAGDKKVVKVIRCLIHIDDTGVWDLLRQYCQSKISNSGSFQVEFFNMDATQASLIVNQFQPYNPDTAGENPHVVVIGLGSLGQRIALQAARDWVYTISQVRDEKLKTLKLELTMVDSDASRKAGALKSLYPYLENYCSFNPIDMPIDPQDFLSKNCPVRFQGNLTSIYLCYDDCSSAISTAFALAGKLGDKKVPLIISLNTGSGLATLVKKLDGSSEKPGSSGKLSPASGAVSASSAEPSSSTVRVVELRDVIDRPVQILENSDYERMARLIHQEYVANQKKRGIDVSLNPSMGSWENLPESLLDSNRSQAYDIDTKLAMIGCVREPLKSDSEPLFSFTEAEIAHLAIEEHKRWYDERVRNGWSYAKSKDIFRKKNPNLASWNALDPDIQKYDVEAVENIPGTLKTIGYEISRKTDIVRIGVTGHRPEKLSNVKGVQKSIGEVLSNLHKIPQDGKKQPAGLQRSYTIVSMLAEGADRLVVKTAHSWGKSHGIPVYLYAVLPFDEKEYADDFLAQESKNEFNKLLKTARFTTTFDTRDGKTGAYQEAGYYVAETCDYLIAIWNEACGDGKGGTADVVQYALSKGIRVFIINSYTGDIKDLQMAGPGEKLPVPARTGNI